jgi:RNA polymerase sigma-70 factor (ECF subfamily)
VRLDDTPVPSQLADLISIDFNRTTAADLARLTRKRIEEFRARSQGILATLTDEELVLRVARNRDTRAFEVLYERLYPSIRASCRSFLADRVSAEDVASDVLVRLWEHADRFDPGKGSLWIWLRHTANNAAVDHYRRTSSLVRLCEPAKGSEAVDTRPNPEEATLLRELLSRAVESLSSSDRQVIALSLHGTHFKEIAQILDVPESEVTCRYHRAIQKLRMALAGLQSNEDANR